MKDRGPLFVLEPSPINGIGVFAVKPIRRGVPLYPLIFGYERAFIPLSDMPDHAGRKFIMKRNGMLMRPPDWHAMPIGFYVNHADTPNVDKDCRTAKRIRAGEEITMHYGGFR